MASARSILLKLTGDPEDAKRAIREVAAEAKEFARRDYTANLDIKTAGTEAKLKKLRAQLDGYARQKPTAEVQIRMARVVEQIDRLQLKLERLKHERVNIDVDVKRGAFERLTAGFNKLFQDFGTFIRDGERVGEAFARVGEKITAVFAGLLSKIPVVGGAIAKPFEVGASAMGGMAQAGLAASPVVVVLIGVMVQLAQVVGLLVQGLIGLGAALITLVASLTAAIGGFLALATAAGAALAPVLLVGIVLFKEITDAVKAKQKAEQQHAAALAKVKSAQQGVNAAQQQSRSATQNLRDVTVQAFQAMRQSADDYRHALLGIESSRLGLEGARLQVRQAKQDLRDFLGQAGATGQQINELVKTFGNVDFNPAKARGVFSQVTGKSANDPLQLAEKILALKQAYFGVKEAQQGVRDSLTTLSTAEARHNDFVRRGIAAYGPYRTALEQVRSADRRLTTANDSLASAQRKVAAPLKGLTSDQRTLAGAITGVERAVKRAFGPALHASLGGILSFLRSLSKFLASRDVQSGLKAIGTAFGDIFRSFGRLLGEKDVQRFFGEMSKAGASLVRLGGRGLIAVFKILETVARTALPLLLTHGRGLVAMLEGIASRPDKIRQKVTSALRSFEIWLGIIKNAFSAVAGVLKALKPLGDAKATGLRDLLGKFATFANSPKGKTRIQAFFENLEKGINALPKALDKFLGVAKDVGKTFSGWHDSVSGVVGLLGGAVSGHGEHAGKNAGKLFKGVRELGQGLIGLVAGHQQGGPILGSGRGDIVPIMAEPGEFMIRRAVTNAIGIPALSALNAGVPPSVVFAGVGGGDTIFSPEIHVVGGGSPDARILVAKLEREYRRRF